MGLSIRAYARHRGVSHTAVQKAIRSGRIALEPDGSVDPTKADAAWAANTTPPERAPRTAPSANGPAPTRQPNTRPVPEAAVGAVRETLQENGAPISSSGPMTFLQARTANEVLKAQERRLRLQKLKGELVDRARATALVFKLARQERDSLLNLPARISAEMAAELGVDALVLQTVLEKFIRTHLSELAEIRPAM